MTIAGAREPKSAGSYGPKGDDSDRDPAGWRARARSTALRAVFRGASTKRPVLRRLALHRGFGGDVDGMAVEVLHSYGVRAARFRNQARARAWRSRIASIGAWRIYLLASLLGAVAYFLLPRGSIAQAVDFIACEAVAVGVLASTVVRARASERKIWLALTAGQGLGLAGNAFWYLIPTISKVVPTFPSTADGMFLGSFAVSMLGLVLMIRARSNGQGWVPNVDAAIVMMGVVGLSFVTVIDPSLHAAGGSVVAKAISIVYPVLDLLILALVVRLTATGGMRNASVLMFTCWAISQFTGDSLFAAATLHGAAFQFGDICFAGWLLAFACMGTAVLHPSRERLLSPVSRPMAASLGRTKLVFLGVASVVVPGILVFDLAVGDSEPQDLTFVAALAVATFLLVFARLAGLLRDLAVSEKDTRYLSLHDVLTGLANRALVLDRTTQALVAAPRRQEAIGLLMIDLDSFKQVNDGLGHDAGDQLLRLVGECLRGSIRAGDTAARLGGDEFCALLQNTDEMSAARVAQRINKALGQPVVYGGKELTASASIGIAVSRGRNYSAEELFRCADVAMYAAKALGKGRYEIFNPSMHAEILEAGALQQDLERAVARDEFVVQYQPIVGMNSGRLVGVEALVRWDHPRRGLLPPSEFIDMAEDTGAIVPLGELVLRKACMDFGKWQREFPSAAGLNLSVNFSARQLLDPDLTSLVLGIIDVAGLQPSSLTVEVTERVMVSEASIAQETLASLRAAGIKVAIDDFGTGYSSLGYLRQLPADEVKIDRLFVNQVASEDDRAFSLSIIRVIEALGMETVAEGIETAEQAAYMGAMGCDRGQGYYFARPLSVDAVSDLLVSQRTFDVGERDSGPMPVPIGARGPRPAVNRPTISSGAFGLVDREPDSRPNRREAPTSALASSWLRI
jgi:diguanylate cyclase (GGDEF)-like protein